MADRQIHVDLNLLGVSRILGLPDGVGAQEPATVAQLRAVQEATAWKDNVRVRTPANVNLASPGATLDGVTMAAGDRVLVAAQTAGAENGLYVWNGAATPMTRAADASTWEELVNARVPVDAGTSAGSVFQHTTVTGTLGTTAITFASSTGSAPPASDTAAGIIEIATQAEVNAGTDATRAVTPATLAGYTGHTQKRSGNIGDGSALTLAFTHNLNTRDVQVGVFLNSGTYDELFPEIERTDLNTVTIKTNVAPAANAWRIVVIG